MFGLGWGWPVAATLALLALIGLARILLSDTTDNEKTPGAPDRDADVDELWHQYEEGDTRSLSGSGKSAWLEDEV